MKNLDKPIHEIASEIFFPRPDIPYGPEAVGAWDHFFGLSDGVSLRLRIFYGPLDAPNILFFHGNGETARDYDFIADEIRRLPATFLVAEYRGYGPSGGSPSINTFLNDAHETLDEVVKLLRAGDRKGPLVSMGRSLGSAPALELASSRPGECAALIIESGFALTVPLLMLLGIPCKEMGIEEEQGPRNLEKMKQVSMPTLIMHAENDDIISITHAEILQEACGDPHCRFMRVPNAGHNDIQHRAGEYYFEAIGRLLGRL